MDIVSLAIDLSKQIFQLHGYTKDGAVFKKRITGQAAFMKQIEALPKNCEIGIEACGGAHYYCNRFTAMGHKVKMIPPAYVKPFVKRNKTDANDAEAIHQAMFSKAMRFVTPKTQEQQDLLTVHSKRQQLIRNRTASFNQLRAVLFERGIIVPKGKVPLMKRVKEILLNNEVNENTKQVLEIFIEEIEQLEVHISKCDKIIENHAKTDEACRLLLEIPGIGLITASAMVATIGTDVSQFKSARELSAWLGLTPRVVASGARSSNLGITKKGDGYLRRLLIHGSHSSLRWEGKRKEANANLWVRNLCTKKPMNKVAVAMANKTARIIYAILRDKKPYVHSHSCNKINELNNG